MRRGNTDACRYVYGVAHDACVAGPLYPRHEVHPPLAKWLIAAGIRVFGNTPLGWRIVRKPFWNARVREFMGVASVRG